MNFTLPKIYPITDAQISQISHAEQVKKMIEGGATFIQLREKHNSPKDFYNAALNALKIARQHNVKIIINDRVDLALALEADGVHLGQDDMPPEKARKILGEKAIIGFSTHNLEQARHAVKLPIDYLAIGPIFDTRTKTNPDAVVGVEFLKILRAEVGDFPIVAIGGINSSNFLDVLNNGADSVAIISDLLVDPNQITSKLKLLIESSH